MGTISFGLEMIGAGLVVFASSYAGVQVARRRGTWLFSDGETRVILVAAGLICLAFAVAGGVMVVSSLVA